MDRTRESRERPAKRSGGKGKALSSQRAKGKATLSCHYVMPCHFDKFMTAGLLFFTRIRSSSRPSLSHIHLPSYRLKYLLIGALPYSRSSVAHQSRLTCSLDLTRIAGGSERCVNKCRGEQRSNDRNSVSTEQTKVIASILINDRLRLEYY